MRTFFHSVALVKSSRPSSACTSISQTKPSFFHHSEYRGARSCDSCPLKDSCGGRRGEGAECEPDNQSRDAEKEVVDAGAGRSDDNDATGLPTIVVEDINNKQEKVSSKERRKTLKVEEPTTASNSTMLSQRSAQYHERNQQRLQELDKRIKALYPGFFEVEEPEVLGLRLILQQKRDELRKEEDGVAEETVSRTPPASRTWPEESISRAHRPGRQGVAEHERCEKELREVEAQLEALSPAYEAREDESLEVREILEKQRDELKREVEWFDGLDWVGRTR